jgi:hypothetical protein
MTRDEKRSIRQRLHAVDAVAMRALVDAMRGVLAGTGAAPRTVDAALQMFEAAQVNGLGALAERLNIPTSTLTTGWYRAGLSVQRIRRRPSMVRAMAMREVGASWAMVAEAMGYAAQQTAFRCMREIARGLGYPWPLGGCTAARIREDAVSEWEADKYAWLRLARWLAGCQARSRAHTLAVLRAERVACSLGPVPSARPHMRRADS